MAEMMRGSVWDCPRISRGNNTSSSWSLVSLSGAGKSVTVCDLLTQTEGYFGYTVIIEEGLSYGIYAAHSASQRLSGNQNMRQDPKAVVLPTRMLSFQRERLLLHFRDYRRRAPPVAIGAFAAQSQIAHPIEPAILDRAEQRRPVGAGLDWFAARCGTGHRRGPHLAFIAREAQPSE